jgi:tRNA pseudouridine38-40 synthase
MRTLKLTLAYDGTAYAGWQVQSGQKTVQEVLEKTLAKITGEPVRIVGSGRTDAGVHALGQVASFRTNSRLPTEVFQRALNAELPDDIAVREAIEAAESFHALRDAVRKRYRYIIHDGPVPDIFQRHYCWHYYGRLDAEAMARAAHAILGTHDFSSFETSGAERRTSVRTVYEASLRRGEGPTSHVLTFEIEANGFLYNMVRAIVGSLVEVGRGAREEGWMAEILAAVDRRVAGPTAPPQGLFLVRVDYEQGGQTVNATGP